MEERIARFIAALRAMGVRVSLAESQDAWRAIQHIGITNREAFRLSLRTTLVKDARSFAAFDKLFPLYFGTERPPMSDPQADLSPEQQQMLQDALRQLMQDLKQLMDWLLNGQGPTREELQELAEQAGMGEEQRLSPYRQRQYVRRLKQLLEWQLVQELLEALWQMLAEQGMDRETLQELKQMVGENREALEKQLDQFVGQRLLDQMVDEIQHRDPIDQLMERSLDSLGQAEMELLREQVQRLAARLRSRAALRYKRGKQGRLDAKTTIRANLRYGGVPFEMHFKQHRLKPKLVAILDVSTSMRPVAEFFVRLLYQLQDQIQKTRSFAFIDHLEDVSSELTSLEADEAVYTILTKLPPGHYNTDLGYSLRQFEAEHMDTVDSRTTFIVLGDARNNFNDPAIDIFGNIRRRARRVIWMNPEHPARWGTGDSDMLEYAPLCSEVYQVQNLAQLVDAIDNLLS